jgi:hypothetical protein
MTTQLQPISTTLALVFLLSLPGCLSQKKEKPQASNPTILQAHPILTKSNPSSASADQKTQIIVGLLRREKTKGYTWLALESPAGIRYQITGLGPEDWERAQNLIGSPIALQASFMEAHSPYHFTPVLLLTKHLLPAPETTSKTNPETEPQEIRRALPFQTQGQIPQKPQKIGTIEE